MADIESEGQATKQTKEEIVEINKKISQQNEQQIKETEVIGKKMNDVADAADELNKTEKKTNKVYKEREGIMTKLSSICKSMKEETLGVADAAGLSLFSFKSLLGETLKINSELFKMSATLGKINGNGFEQVREAFTTATKGIGESFENARETVNTLINNGYIGNFSEATKAISMFSKATDVNRASVAQTFDFLNKTMKMSENGTASVFASMQKISQTYGLTRKGMETVTASIKTMTTNMKAFGSTQTDVKNMAVGMTKLASEMEKVGLSADKAARLVEKLTDPDELTNNIGLYAQLGMSLSDALSGNFDTTQMQTGLIEFGNKVKEMGPIAGSAYAKAFNMSYKDAVMQADMKQITEEALTPETKAMKSLENALDRTQDGFAQVETALNKIKGMFSAMGPAILGVIALVYPKIKAVVKEILNGLKKTKDGIEGVEKKSRRQQRLEHNKAANELIKEQTKGLSGIDKKREKRLLLGELTANEYSNMGYKWERSKKTNFAGDISRGAEDALGAITSPFKKIGRGISSGVSAGANKYTSGAGKILGGAFGGLKTIGGGLLKALGPIGIVLSVLAPILQKNEKFMSKINKAMEVIEKTLTPVIDSLMEALEPLADAVVNAIGPILKLLLIPLKIITPIISIIAKILTPIVNAIGKIADWITGGTFHKDQEDNTKALNENTEAQQNQREKIYTKSDGRVAATSASITSGGEIIEESRPVNSSAVNNTKTTDNVEQTKTEITKTNKTLGGIYAACQTMIETMQMLARSIEISMAANNMSDDFFSNKGPGKSLGTVISSSLTPVVEKMDSLKDNTNRMLGSSVFAE